MFQSGDVERAIELFELATRLSPNNAEAMAAYYNLGCAYTKNKQFDRAVEAVMKAVNDYDMKLLVALKDPDLKSLRERREWLDKVPAMKGALSRDTKVQLRSEAKAPFRFSRLLLVGSLTAGAGLGLLIILLRLVKALQGGADAPNLAETLENLGINTAALAVLGTILFYDLKGKEKDLKVVLREEDLARLQVEVSRQRVVPLVKLRGFCRPIVIAGSKTYVDRCVKSARPYEPELRQRGITLVPVVFSFEDSAKSKLKEIREELQRSKPAGFGSLDAPPAPSTLNLNEDEERSKPALEQLANNPTAEIVMKESQRRLMYPAYDLQEWKEWLDLQKELAKLSKVQQNCYVQVQLDGRVRSSGLGQPNWIKMIEDIPALDDVRTTFTDGIVGDA